MELLTKIILCPFIILLLELILAGIMWICILSVVGWLLTPFVAISMIQVLGICFED